MTCPPHKGLSEGGWSAGVAGVGLRYQGWTFCTPRETAWWKHKVLVFGVWDSFLKVHGLGKLLMSQSLCFLTHKTDKKHPPVGCSLGSKQRMQPEAARIYDLLERPILQALNQYCSGTQAPCLLFQVQVGKVSPTSHFPGSEAP